MKFQLKTAFLIVSVTFLFTSYSYAFKHDPKDLSPETQKYGIKGNQDILHSSPTNSMSPKELDRHMEMGYQFYT